MSLKIKRTCAQGHVFYKSSQCKSCPQCEAERKPTEGFLALFPAPARRVLEQHGVYSPETLAQYTEKEVLQWHGIGPSSIPKMKHAMKTKKISFRLI